MQAMPPPAQPAPVPTGKPHSATFAKATCKEWVEALVFRYGEAAVRNMVDGIGSDMALASKVVALVGHFGDHRVRAALNPPPCTRCGGSCPPRADGYCAVLGFPATRNYGG